MSSSSHITNIGHVEIVLEPGSVCVKLYCGTILGDAIDFSVGYYEVFTTNWVQIRPPKQFHCVF